MPIPSIFKDLLVNFLLKFELSDSHFSMMPPRSLQEGHFYQKCDLGMRAQPKADTRKYFHLLPMIWGVIAFFFCSGKPEISAKPISNLFSYTAGKSGHTNLFILSSDDREIMLNVVFILNQWVTTERKGNH